MLNIEKIACSDLPDYYTQEIVLLLCSSLDPIGNGFAILLYGHGKLDLRFVHGRAEKCIEMVHISKAEIAEENNLPRVLEKYV